MSTPPSPLPPSPPSPPPNTPVSTPAEMARQDVQASQARWGEALRWAGLVVAILLAGVMLRPPSGKQAEPFVPGIIGLPTETDSVPGEPLIKRVRERSAATEQTPSQVDTAKSEPKTTTYRKSNPPPKDGVRTFGAGAAPANEPTGTPTEEPKVTTYRKSNPPPKDGVRTFGAGAAPANESTGAPAEEPKVTTYRKSNPPPKDGVRTFGAGAAPANESTSTPAEEPKGTTRRKSNPPKDGKPRAFGPPLPDPSERGTIVTVAAAAETAPMETGGDAADDPAIWVHPTDAGKSLIVSTNKKAGVRVYDLSGREVQTISDGTQANNVDVLYAHAADGTPADLVLASDTVNSTILTYRIDAETGRLSPGTPVRVQTGFAEVYGLCVCPLPPNHAHSQDALGYVFVNDMNGGIEQWLVSGDPRGWLNWTRLRSLSRAGKCEGMVADPAHGSLYVCEEDAAVWRFDIDPASTAEPRAIERAQPTGRFAPDAEGIACVRTGEQEGYLIVSSQGDGVFLVYNRRPPNEYVGAFRIGDNASRAIDGVSQCDGIDAISTGLGSAFPDGVFVCQDGENPGANQNFKLVRWGDIAGSFTPALEQNPGFTPRPRAPRPSR